MNSNQRTFRKHFCFYITEFICIKSCVNNMYKNIHKIVINIQFDWDKYVKPILLPFFTLFLFLLFERKNRTKRQ